MGLEYSSRNGIAFFKINNPQSLNALDAVTLAELGQAMTAFDADASLRVGIVTGSGEKAFCSGIDLHSTLKKDSRDTLPPTPMRGLEVEKPLIAAVNGVALGGGFELVLACDIRIAAGSAVFGFPEAGLGLIPGWGGTQRLIRQTSWCQTAALLFTAQSIDAATAARYGLLNAVVPAAELLNTATRWAEAICRAAPLAVKAAKEAMAKGIELPLSEGLQLEDALCGYLKTTADFSEGLRAYQEKRPPCFRSE
jgi:enoyl-CoA hydratase/carnithine racemase